MSFLGTTAKIRSPEVEYSRWLCFRSRYSHRHGRLERRNRFNGSGRQSDCGGREKSRSNHWQTWSKAHSKTFEAMAASPSGEPDDGGPAVPRR